jgi:hypothetical protein
MSEPRRGAGGLLIADKGYVSANSTLTSTTTASSCDDRDALPHHLIGGNYCVRRIPGTSSATSCRGS